MYNLLANIIMSVHAALIIFVFIGVAVSIKIKRFRPVEASVLLSAIAIWSLYGGCPLTSAENYLRVLADKPIPLVENGFIAYYLASWFGIVISNTTISIATYLISILFVGLTIEWEMPYIKTVLKRK